MGKSRLVQQVKTALVAEGFTPIAYWGSPYAPHTALYPVVEWLQGCVYGDGDPSGPERLALLQTVTPLEKDVLRQDLKHLVEAELLYQRGVGTTAVYQFKHALMQEAAYTSLLRKVRQYYHQHITQVSEMQFPDIVATQPELPVQHYTSAVAAAGEACGSPRPAGTPLRVVHRGL